MNQWVKIYSFLMCLFLAACGGGGGGESPTPSSGPDVRPNFFLFITESNAPVSTEVTSNTIIVGGINAGEAPISIIGGQYAIDDGAFTNANGKIRNGQAVRVQLTSSELFSTSKKTTLDIGGVTADFTVITQLDNVPDNFVFDIYTEVGLGQEYISNTVFIDSIETTTSIEIAGGEYSIRGGEFTSAPGTVAEGDSVRVKAVSADMPLTTTTTTLTVGGIQRDFSMTTKEDTEAPQSALVFPPAHATTTNDTIIVRGTTTDDSKITSVRVNNLDVTTDDDFNTWTVELPLAEGVNTLTIDSFDVSGNTVSTVNSVTVKRGSELLTNAGAPTEISLDKLNKRIIYADKNDGAVKALTFDSMEVTVLSSDKGLDSEFTFYFPQSLAVDYVNHKAYIARSNQIGEINLLTGERKAFSTPEIPDGTLAFSFIENIVIDSPENRLLVTDRALSAIIAVNLTTGARTIFSDNTNVEEDLIIETYTGIYIDREENRILVTDRDGRKAFAIDMHTQERSTYVSVNSWSFIDFYPDNLIYDKTNNQTLFSSPWGILHLMDMNTRFIKRLDPRIYSNEISLTGNPVLDEENNIGFVGAYHTASSDTGAIIAIDLRTQQMVNLSL